MSIVSFLIMLVVVAVLLGVFGHRYERAGLYPYRRVAFPGAAGIIVLLVILWIIFR